VPALADGRSGLTRTVKADHKDRARSCLATSGEERPTDDRSLSGMKQGQILVGGKWREPTGGQTIAVVNPSTGAAFAELARGTADDVDLAVQAAHAALAGDWGRMAAFERGRILARLGQLVLEQVEPLARLEAQEIGKPLRQARADAKSLARCFEFYGGAADKVHGATIPYHTGTTVLTLREPHGVTGHIVPWSDPLQVLGRSVGPALAMGNACVLKPAEDGALAALEVGRLALEAGLPPGALNIVPGHGEEAGAALAAHPGIDHVSFTGSRAVGRAVQKAAAEHGCPVTLELGGKSPQLVFADAELDQALPAIVNAAIQNAGPACSAGCLLLLEDRIYDAFVVEVANRFHILDVGEALRDLDCGPLINARELERVQGCLAQAHRDRLLLLAEGKIAPNTPEGGFFVKPTLLGEVPPDHPLAQEEIFAPLLLAIRFQDEGEAIRIANGTPYGLVAGVWTRDGARQLRLARALRAGQVFVNTYGTAGGVELPFGGTKGSGFGRGKGFEAVYGFSTLKTVVIRHG
jgi:aldehyde dehydrogenase (NAD+)